MTDVPSMKLLAILMRGPLSYEMEAAAAPSQAFAIRARAAAADAV